MLEARKRTSRRLQTWFLLKVIREGPVPGLSSWPIDNLSSPWLYIVSLVHVSVLKISLFIRTPIMLDLGSPEWPHFNLNTSVKTSSQTKTHSEVLGLRTPKYEFGGLGERHNSTHNAMLRNQRGLIFIVLSGASPTSVCLLSPVTCWLC